MKTCVDKFESNTTKIVEIDFERVKQSEVKQKKCWEPAFTPLSQNVFNPLPDDKVLGLPKLKAFADNKLNVTQKC